MMSEMVERVAKAMWDRTHDGSWEDRGDGQDESRDIYLEDSRIGVAAMREPTTKMIDIAAKVDVERAGNDETNSTYNLRDEEIEFVWYAMIDEALK
jgi:hypothetical protein